MARGFKLDVLWPETPLAAVRTAVDVDKIAEAAAGLVLDTLHESDWPVDTGFSLAGFAVDVTDGRLTVTNRADYAVFVEQRTGIAAAAVGDGLGRIADVLAGEIAEQVNDG